MGESEMSYWTSDKMVEDNAAFLERTLERLMRGREMRIPLRGLNLNPSKERYRVRQLLAATSRHPNAAAGRFRRLGDLARVSYDAGAEEIVISPKNRAALIDLLDIPPEREKEIDPELLEELARHGITPESHNEAHEAAREKKKGLSMIPKFDPSLLEKKDE